MFWIKSIYTRCKVEWTHTQMKGRGYKTSGVWSLKDTHAHTHTHHIIFLFHLKAAVTNVWYISIQVYIFTVERFAYLLFQMMVNLHINKSCMIFTFMHLADAFIQSDLQLHSGYTFFVSICVPWESNPQPFVLLTQCSTTEPHRNTYLIW